MLNLFSRAERVNPERKRFITEPLRQRLWEQRTRTVFERFGFKEISIPLLELDNIKDYGYSFLANNIGKIVGTHFRFSEKPIRLYYIANLFLSNIYNMYMVRDLYQAGAEIVGSENTEADIEIIIMVIETLQELGLEEFKIDIGHSNFWRIIFKKIGFPEEDINKIENLLRNKCFTSLNNLLSDRNLPENLYDIITRAPFLRGKFELLNSFDTLRSYDEIRLLIEDITNTCNILEDYGLGDYFTLDFSLMGDLPCYDGYVFECYTSDLGVILGNGGRQNRLLEDIGYKCPTTGFSIHINRVVQAILKSQNLNSPIDVPDFFVTRTDKFSLNIFKVARELRRKGFLVEVEITNRTLEESLDYAKNRSIKSVIILSDKDTEKKQILLKNMETDDETIIDFNEFLV